MIDGEWAVVCLSVSSQHAISFSHCRSLPWSSDKYSSDCTMFISGLILSKWDCDSRQLRDFARANVPRFNRESALAQDGQVRLIYVTRAIFVLLVDFSLPVSAEMLY